ncbi:MAG: Trx7/PDZ domain-containing (seleno)protein [Planctomycetota bacterium]
MLARDFVCARVVHMGDVDLDLFQFDYDMTWAAFFMNADLTIYGRYGSRNAVGQGSNALISLSSLKQAMERALEIHKNYPANRDSLAAKRGPPVRWKRPRKIPSLPPHAKRARPPATCVHCHHIPVGVRRSLIDEKKLLTDEQIWVYPYPKNTGLEIDIAHGRRVKHVRAGSPAARAGVKAGDVIDTMNGQPITSIADMQWVLHRLPRKAELTLGVAREAKTAVLSLALDGDWKHSDISWRISTWCLRPGLKLVELTAEERARAGLASDTLALRIAGIPRTHVSRQSGGFKRGDILIEVAGNTDAMTEGELIAFLRTRYKKGTALRVVLLRDGRRVKQRLKVG